jgi:hypothetical protein
VGKSRRDRVRGARRIRWGRLSANQSAKLVQAPPRANTPGFRRTGRYPRRVVADSARKQEQLADAARKKAALLDATTPLTAVQTRDTIQRVLAAPEQRVDSPSEAIDASQERLLMDMVDAARSAPRHEQKWHLQDDVLTGPWGTRKVLDDDVHALSKGGFLRVKQRNYVYGNTYVLTSSGYRYADGLRERDAPTIEPTGWTAVDEAIQKLQEALRSAEDEEDFKAVGLSCLSALSLLGRTAFDAERHLPSDQNAPHADDANGRLGLFLSAVAPGRRFEHVRRLLRAAWDQAQAVKHRSRPDRTDAGIAVDAVVLLTSMIRRLSEDDVAQG